MIETYERFDFLAETAKDQYIYDENGEAYLDFYAGIAVNSAGNCNEKVVAAVRDQVGDIMHTFNYPYTIPQALLAEKICTTIRMDKIFLPPFTPIPVRCCTPCSLQAWAARPCPWCSCSSSIRRDKEVIKRIKSRAFALREKHLTQSKGSRLAELYP